MRTLGRCGPRSDGIVGGFAEPVNRPASPPFRLESGVFGPAYLTVDSDTAG